ncbi:unnamed protein product [Mycena citricolor]|uniref:Uncharacterized protein n=1 Tax=Mycena citricolor TaxID=2018698 RepID=A0AAD2HXC0_9AGAR|nr:unnamed protein product [Mycena citricolor]
MRSLHRRACSFLFLAAIGSVSGSFQMPFVEDLSENMRNGLSPTVAEGQFLLMADHHAGTVKDVADKLGVGLVHDVGFIGPPDAGNQISLQLTFENPLPFGMYIDTFFGNATQRDGELFVSLLHRIKFSPAVYVPPFHTMKSPVFRGAELNQVPTSNECRLDLEDAEMEIRIEMPVLGAQLQRKVTTKQSNVRCYVN